MGKKNLELISEIIVQMWMKKLGDNFRANIPNVEKDEICFIDPNPIVGKQKISIYTKSPSFPQLPVT